MKQFLRDFCDDTKYIKLKGFLILAILLVGMQIDYYL